MLFVMLLYNGLPLRNEALTAQGQHLLCQMGRRKARRHSAKTCSVNWDDARRGGTVPKLALSKVGLVEIYAFLKPNRHRP